jgi:hydrogenase maturation protease
VSDGRRPLVICYGNRLRGDDGVAWHVAERLVADGRLAGADVLCAHQLTPELALEVSRASVAVLVDAAVDGIPGTVRRRPVTIIPGSCGGPAWSHALTADALAGLSAALYGRVPPIDLVTVTGASFGVSEHLSAPVGAAIADAAAAVALAVTTAAPTPMG